MSRQKVLALVGWGEDQQVWERLPSGPRAEAIAQCARLVMRVAQEETMSDEEEHGGGAQAAE